LDLLIPGLVLFLAIHLLPSFPGIREILMGKLKRLGYMALFNLLSITSIALIIFGLMEASFQPLYDPPGWGRHLAMLLMLPAVYFFLSNTLVPTPSSVKVFTAHPVNWGVILWSTGHLFANGDLAHVLFFITLWIFSMTSIVTGSSRGLKPVLAQRPPLATEAILLVSAVIVYCVVIWGHPFFTGMPLIIL
jgi:uncharacterized membrane protein